MASLVLQIFFIITISNIAISKSLKNATSSVSSELETSSQDVYESPIIQVSPLDIENNTGPFIRSDSGLNRLLALSNQHNLAIDNNLNTDALSADNLANQIGVTVIEPNPLVNLVNTDTSAQVSDPQVKPNPVDLSTQSVNDFLNYNALLNQIPNNNQLTNQYIINAVKTPQEIKGYMPKVYPEVMKDASDTQLNTFPSISQGQGVNNIFQQGTVLTDANDQLLKSIQLLLNQEGDYTRKNVYQTPNQLAVDDPTLNLGVLGLDKEAARDNQIMALLGNSATNQRLDVDSLLGEAAFNTNHVMDFNAVTGQGSNANQYLNTNLESILGQDVDMSNIQSLLQANQGNQYGTLPNTNLETRLVFDNQIPNLNEPNCRSAFGALVNNALMQYLKLAQLPFCMGSGHKANPSTYLPFQIIIAPTGTSAQSNTNPLMLKMLWILLNKLKNQPFSPLQDRSHLPIPVQSFNNAAVQSPNKIGDNLLASLNPNQNLPSVLPFDSISNQKLNPSQQYDNNVINQKYPNLIPDYPFLGHSGVDSGPNQFPMYPGPTMGTPSPFQRTTHNPSGSLFEPQYPTQPPGYANGFPILPNSPMKYPTDLSTGNLPIDYTDSLSNPLVKYLIQLFRKFQPLQVLSSDDIVYLTQLINTLPKTYNELLQNPAVLQQTILQLSNRHLNPQLVLSLLYKYVIPLNQPSLHGATPSDRVVLIKYQVKRHTPYVYQPYYYVQYKLPYSNFVKNLQQLLMSKPYLKLNRTHLLKELLIAAISNNYGTSSDLNGVSKEYLMQLIANQGATPLDVEVVNDNISYEQLKLLNDFNAQLRSDSTVPQTGLNSGLLGGGQVLTGSNVLPYLGQSSLGKLTNLNLADLTTVHPLLKHLRRSENAGNTVQQARDEVSDQQEDLPSVDVNKKPSIKNLTETN